MRIPWIAIPLCLWLALAPAAVGFDLPPRPPSEMLADCPTLDACMAILDRLPKLPYGVTSDDDPKVTTILVPFGEPAKLALLDRAGRADAGWSNYAGALLRTWPDFTPADVPALIRGLRRDPGGWISNPLGRVGTPEAFAALAEDVKAHGAGSQSSWALKTAGAKAVPYLMPLLEDDRAWNDAASILRDMGDAAASLAPGWTARALDDRQPVIKRVAALRALSALGTYARDQGPFLRPLLQDRSSAIVAIAAFTLRAMGDRSTLEGIVDTCRPATVQGRPEPFSAIHFNAWCLGKIAAFGAEAKPFGPLIAERFLKSANGVDRDTGAAALGYIGYDAAIPALIGLLKDSDWRVAYAAARSLGWLHATSAAPALAATARLYWLSDVRKEARAVLDTFRSGAPPLDRPAIRLGGSQSPDVPLEIDATFAPDVAPCASGHWRYGEMIFAEPHERRMRVASGVPGDGEFSAADDGEWGGGLWWAAPAMSPGLPRNAANSQGVEASSTGAVAVFGEIGTYASYQPETPDRPGLMSGNAPTGNGYVLSLTVDAARSLHMKEIARLPRGADVMTTIGPDLYAVWSGGRAIVFSLQGIQSVAVCTP